MRQCQRLTIWSGFPEHAKEKTGRGDPRLTIFVMGPTDVDWKVGDPQMTHGDPGMTVDRILWTNFQMNFTIFPGEFDSIMTLMIESKTQKRHHHHHCVTDSASNWVSVTIQWYLNQPDTTVCHHVQTTPGISSSSLYSPTLPFLFCSDWNGCVCVYYCSTYHKDIRVGEGDSGGHVVWETMNRDLCGLVCQSHTSERGGEGDCVKEGGGEEREFQRERTLGLLLWHSPRHWGWSELDPQSDVLTDKSLTLIFSDK